MRLLAETTLVLFLVAGCGNTKPEGGLPDLGHHVDLATSHDLQGAPDLAVLDLVTLPPDVPIENLDIAAPIDAGVTQDIAVHPANDGFPVMDFAMAPDMATGVADLTMAPPPDLRGFKPDLTMPPPGDMATTSPPDLTTLTDAQLACMAIKVNEIQTGDSQSATDEFVEIYNPCPVPVSLIGWKLVYRAGTNTNPASSPDDSTLYDFTLGAVNDIAAFGLRTFGGQNFFGTEDDNLLGSLRDGLGAVALRDPTGAIVDSVGYGSADPKNAFVETAPAPTPPVVDFPGNSIGRIPDGHDTNDNSKDFKVSSAPTPDAPNM